MFCYFVWKDTHKPLEVTTATKLFLRCICYCYNCYCYVIASINFLTLFFRKVYQYPDVFWIVMFLHSLKKVIWRSPHFIFCHHNKTKMLIQKWKVPKWISRILYLQIFWTISYFWCSTFYKWNVFKKIKTLWKHVFSNTIFLF